MSSQYTHLGQEDQQYPPTSQVPSYDPVQQSSDGWSGGVVNEVGPTGCSVDSFRRVFVSAGGVLRLLQFLFAIIAFGTMANQDNYTNQASFGFLVFTGVVAWLFVVAMITAHIFDLHSRFSWLYLVEFGLDVLFALFSISAGIAVAYKCQKDDGQGHEICSDSQYSKSRASAAFSFLLGFSLLGSSILSYRRFRNPPRGGNVSV